MWNVEPQLTCSKYFVNVVKRGKDIQIILLMLKMQTIVLCTHVARMTDKRPCTV